MIRPGGGGDQRLADVARQQFRLAHAAPADLLEGADHAADRAEQPEHRRDAGDQGQEVDPEAGRASSRPTASAMAPSTSGLEPTGSSGFELAQAGGQRVGEQALRRAGGHLHIVPRSCSFARPRGSAPARPAGIIFFAADLPEVQHDTSPPARMSRRPAATSPNRPRRSDPRASSSWRPRAPRRRVRLRANIRDGGPQRARHQSHHDPSAMFHVGLLLYSAFAFSSNICSCSISFRTAQGAPRPSRSPARRRAPRAGTPARR